MRAALGIISLAILVTGAVMFFGGNGDDYVGSVLIRAGAVLGALWLVLPATKRVSRSTLIGLGVFAAVLVFRPRLVLWAFVAGVAIAVVGRFWPGRRSFSGPG